MDRIPLNEMAVFPLVPASGTFIMDDDEVIAQTISFMQNGRFDHSGENDPNTNITATAAPRGH